MTDRLPEEARNCREEERRTAGRRYDIAALAWFRWQLPDGQAQEGSGRTLNISCRGVCLSSAQLPPPGAAIEVIVSIPGLKHGSEISARMRGTGKVLRLSEENGFAAEVGFQLERVGSLPKRTRRSESLYSDADQGKTWPPK